MEPNLAEPTPMYADVPAQSDVDVPVSVGQAEDLPPLFVQTSGEPWQPDAATVVDNTSSSDAAWLALQTGPVPVNPTVADDMRAEVVAENIPDGAVAVPLCGEILHILDAREWFSSANNALNVGDFEGWAQECLAGDEYERLWCRMNDGRGPRLGEITDMFETYRTVTGNDPGKSRPSPNSLRRMQRR